MLNFYLVPVNEVEQVLNALKDHDIDSLDLWYDMPDKKQNLLLRQIADVYNQDPKPIEDYCTQLIPRSEFNSLSIVYESLSEYSPNASNFLASEIQRLTELLVADKIKAKAYDTLSSMELEKMYSFSLPLYRASMTYLIQSINLVDTDKKKKAILEVLDMFMLEIDADDDIPEIKDWIAVLNQIVNSTSGDTLKVAHDVLSYLDDNVEYVPHKSSLFTKILRLIFGS